MDLPFSGGTTRGGLGKSRRFGLGGIIAGMVGGRTVHSLLEPSRGGKKLLGYIAAFGDEGLGV